MEKKVFFGNIQHQDQNRREHDRSLLPSERISLLMKFREEVLPDTPIQRVAKIRDVPIR